MAMAGAGPTLPCARKPRSSGSSAQRWGQPRPSGDQAQVAGRDRRARCAARNTQSLRRLAMRMPLTWAN
jgi:hypothetical protein